MRKLVKGLGAAACLLLFGTIVSSGGQNVPPAGQENAPSQPTTKAPDHASAYYHFMLARRYKELAGIYNRGDYIDHAVSEYKEALEADPESLFLRVELADLYWRVNRVGDAIHEAE